MSLQQGKHIFEDDTYLTQAEMEKYLSGELSRQEQYVIEQKIAANQFNAEAMEGFETVPEALSNVEKYKQEFSNSTSGTPSWLKAPVVIPSLAVLVVFVMTILLVVNHLQTRFNPLEDALIPVENAPTQVPNEQPYLNDFIADQKEIVGAYEIKEEEQISYEVTLENQKEQKKAEVIEVTKPIAEEKIKPKRFEGTIEAKEPSLVDNKLPIRKVKRSSMRSNVILRYVNDLKTVDYSKFYSQDVQVPGFDIGGVDAKYEFSPDADSWDRYSFNTRRVPYNSFLGEAMAKFSENHYKEALQDFRVILEQYPEDHNALFYGGLCYYNLDKSDKAIQFFGQIEKGYINTFYEEARWYKALSLVQFGDENAYEELLQEIATDNGFYASKAKEKLNR